MPTMSDAKEIGIYLGSTALLFLGSFIIAAIVIKTRRYTVYLDDDGVYQVVRPAHPPSTDTYHPPTNIKRYHNVPPNEARTRRHRAHANADPHGGRRQEAVGS
jgi:hypothetical protein